MDERLEKFLEELTELSRKHKIILSACSCCESINAHTIPETEWHKSEFLGSYIGWEGDVSRPVLQGHYKT